MPTQKQTDQWGDPLYCVRKNTRGIIQVTKFEEGRSVPAVTYDIIGDSKGLSCECSQSYRGRYGRTDDRPFGCRHLEIVALYQELLKGSLGEKISYAGVWIDYKTKTYYIPQDGEGIPISGAVDVIGEANYQKIGSTGYMLVL